MALSGSQRLQRRPHFAGLAGAGAVLVLRRGNQAGDDQLPHAQAGKGRPLLREDLRTAEGLRVLLRQVQARPLQGHRLRQVRRRSRAQQGAPRAHGPHRAGLAGAHIWFVKGTPSRLGLLLDISPRNLERVLYFAQYIITHVDEAAKKRALEHLHEEMEKEAERREKEWADMLSSVETQARRRSRCPQGAPRGRARSLEEERLQTADALMKSAVEMRADAGQGWSAPCSARLSSSRGKLVVPGRARSSPKRTSRR